jgi:hypothetical protein
VPTSDSGASKVTDGGSCEAWAAPRSRKQPT